METQYQAQLSVEACPGLPSCQLALTDHPFSVISLSAIVITLSIILSMMQQVNYIIAWKAIKIAAYENAKARSSNPSYALISTYNEFDTILFLIRKSGCR